MFDNFPVKQRVSDKYLGQVLHSAGPESSAEAIVQEIVGRIKGASLEIKSMVEEFEMQAMGGLMAALELWERAIVPSLHSGSGTWFGECKKSVELCDQLQNFFWRLILKVPESCPKVAIRSETGMLGMKWRIWKDEKILLLMRIRKQGEDTLSKQIYEEGKTMGWPGLSQEVKNICKDLEINDVNEEMVSKTVIKKAIIEHHIKQMKEEKKMQKIDDIKHDNIFEVQKYFNEKSIETGRMDFKVRCLMV